MAMGIVMNQRHMDEEDAFDVLRRTSHNTNRKLRDIAEDVIRERRFRRPILGHKPTAGHAGPSICSPSSAGEIVRHLPGFGSISPGRRPARDQRRSEHRTPNAPHRRLDRASLWAECTYFHALGQSPGHPGLYGLVPPYPQATAARSLATERNVRWLSLLTLTSIRNVKLAVKVPLHQLSGWGVHGKV